MTAIDWVLVVVGLVCLIAGVALIATQGRMK
jgi:hypothetical protein